MTTEITTVQEMDMETSKEKRPPSAMEVFSKWEKYLHNITFILNHCF